MQDWHSPRLADLGDGFVVRRALPLHGGKGVGPFIFLDEMGPHTFTPGQGMDVRPHPHIGLSTLTYLFNGAIEHRDSLGTVMTIRPGDVNWMTAGHGIVHSERTPVAERTKGQQVHGLQAWVALPKQLEDTDPTFQHVPAASLERWSENGADLTLVAGAAFGRVAQARVHSRLFYVHANLSAGAEVRLELAGLEGAFYLVEGDVETSSGKRATGPAFLIATKDETEIRIRALSPARGVLLGGEAFPEPRRIWWNLVSSSPEKIEAAKQRWTARQFPEVPGETEFIPLPKGN